MLQKWFKQFGRSGIIIEYDSGGRHIDRIDIWIY
jgi:hypothetical protein